MVAKILYFYHITKFYPQFCVKLRNFAEDLAIIPQFSVKLRNFAGVFLPLNGEKVVGSEVGICLREMAAAEETVIRA